MLSAGRKSEQNVSKHIRSLKIEGFIGGEGSAAGSSGKNLFLLPEENLEQLPEGNQLFQLV
jgi:hypothetical protein